MKHMIVVIIIVTSTLLSPEGLKSIGYINALSSHMNVLLQDTSLLMN